MQAQPRKTFSCRIARYALAGDDFYDFAARNMSRAAAYSSQVISALAWRTGNLRRLLFYSSTFRLISNQNVGNAPGRERHAVRCLLEYFSFL